MSSQIGEQNIIWTSKKCIALTKLLEKNPCLWSGNKHDKNITTLVAKREALISIARALNVPPTQAYKKIENLKTYFRVELAKKQRDESYEPKWYLFKRLKFFNKKKKIKTNINFTPSTKNNGKGAKEVQQPSNVHDPMQDEMQQVHLLNDEIDTATSKENIMSETEQHLSLSNAQDAAQDDMQQNHSLTNGIDSETTKKNEIMIETEIWTKKKCIALANLLGQKPCLWSQTQDGGIKTLIARRNATISIAHELNVSHVQARNKIEDLKEYFQHELAKKLHEGAYESKWYLFERLQFLNTKKKIKTNIDFTPSPEDKITKAEKAQSPSHAHDPGQDEVQDDHLLNDEIDTATSMENIMGEAEELLSLFNAQYPAQDNMQRNHLLNDGIDSGTCTTNKVMMESKEVQSHRRISKEDQDHQSQSCKACEKRKAEYATLSTTLKHWEESISRSSTSAAEQTQDQWDLFGALVAKKMRNLRNATSQIHTERAINQILFRYQTEEQKNVLFGGKGTNEKFTS
ncbi:uncharacterized protein LOC135845277 [Planococcus citri]|uniref:uncharacterized protein LOC135845277 n=1 Tax=Planococcus citri TaxID=170843 RepID=UPI0031F8DF4F